MAEANTEVPCPSGTAEGAASEEALLDLLNQRRALGATCSKRRLLPAPKARRSSALSCAARQQSDDMARFGFFSHVDPGGIDHAARARSHGFLGQVAENLAWGQEAPDQVLKSWLDSAEHCATLFDPGFTEAGAGFSRGAAAKPFWTLVLGRRH